MPKKPKLSETLVLKGALGGIKKELLKLKKDKQKLEKIFGGTSIELQITRQEEIKMRNTLTALSNRETLLADEKERVERDMERLKDRAQKIKKIEEDLEDI